MRDYWFGGMKGPAYFVGSELFGAIYLAFGKEKVFEAMRDPRELLRAYADALGARPDLLGHCPAVPLSTAQRVLSIGRSKE